MRVDRRRFLQYSAGSLGALAAAPLYSAASRLPSQSLADRVAVISAAPGNVVVLTSADGVLLVDTGSAALARAVKASLGRAKVHKVINTHYHADQTGGNALFGKDGAEIHAQIITRQWLAADYYLPAEDRWIKAPPAAAVPSKTFRLKGEMTFGAERVEYGYLLEAHTRGDCYVYCRDSNVLAVGDVASPLRDPALDWYAGGWLGGRVDAMDDLLELANADTRIVPAYGPVMTRAQLQAERDLMLKLYDRTTLLTTKGNSAQDMLEAGVLNDVGRQFADPYRFLYDVAKGHWAHYTNFGGNIV